MRNIHVKITDFNHTSLLHYLLAKEIIVEFNCMDGFCGACHSQLVAGEIAIIKDDLAYKPSGEFLLCCAVPKTDIEIAIY